MIMKESSCGYSHGNKLRRIETGTYIIDTCLICSIESNDIHEITKKGILKDDYPEESSN